MNKHHELIRNGENVEEIYTPTPYWFEKLNFLNRFIKVRKSKLSDTMEYESGSVSMARIHLNYIHTILSGPRDTYH